MPKKRRKPYIQPSRYNPEIIARKVEENRLVIEKLKSTFDHKYQALENFLSLIVNFASHDIKNSVHNLDGIVSTVDVKNITKAEIDSMKLCLDNIRETLEKFTEFNVARTYKSFELINLFQSLDILHRPYLKIEHIEFKVFYDGVDKNTTLNHDFQFLLYMLNNLMINSITALKNAQQKKIHIRISSQDADNIVLLFCDNGCGISPENNERIFHPYFTTKDKGTGVGLTHVKYVLEAVKGAIFFPGPSVDGHVTVFKIVLPLEHHETSNSSN